MPAAIVGIRNATVLEPAAWRRWWWWLDIARAVIPSECASDQAAQNTCRDSPGDNSASVVVAMFAWRVTIRRWRWSATLIAIRPVIILCRCRLDAAKYGAACDDSGKSGEKKFSHLGHLRVSHTECGYKLNMLT